YSDPWLQPEHFQEWLDSLPASFVQSGVLFSSDEIPGGTARAALWRSWVRRHDIAQFLPEFKPAASAWQMAYGLPANVFRTHSIPAAELTALKPDQQRARWQRAVEERSCRLL